MTLENLAATIALLAGNASAAPAQESSVPPQAIPTIRAALKALEQRRDKPRPGKMEAVPASDPANWFSPENYPPQALRAGRQGRVVVDLGIDSAGAVVSCVVKVTSGTTVLDDGTCAVARDKGRFNSATDTRGRPIVGRYLLPVRWVLPDTPPPSHDVASIHQHDSVAIEEFFSAEGILASCRTIEKQKQGGLDPCLAQHVGEQSGVVTRDGKPVPYRLIRRITQDVVIDD